MESSDDISLKSFRQWWPEYSVLCMKFTSIAIVKIVRVTNSDFQNKCVLPFSGYDVTDVVNVIILLYSFADHHKFAQSKSRNQSN